MALNEHFQRLIVALALGLSMTNAQAAEPDRWYMGLSSDVTHVEVWRGLGWEQSGNHRGLTLRGGVRLNRHFAVEIAAIRASNLEWTEYFAFAPGLPGSYDSHAVFDTSTLLINAVGVWPIRSIAEFYVGGGIAESRLSGQQTLVDSWSANGIAQSRSIHSGNAGESFSMGFRVLVNPKWRVRVEYRFFGIDSAFVGVPANDDPTIDSFALGFDYQLGHAP
jgi:hypothetical protein